MGIVVRLRPGLWDVRRLLQFLTGIALVVLALGAAAATPGPVSAAPVPAAAGSHARTAGVTAASDRNDVPAAGPQADQHGAPAPADRADGPVDEPTVPRSLPPAADFVPAVGTACTAAASGPVAAAAAGATRYRAPPLA